MARILSLDDEPEMLDLIKLILGRKGHESLTVTNDYEGWGILHTQPIDLFTQDFMRPGVGGCTFLWMIKSDPTLRNTPVLGISAGARDMRADGLKSMGLNMVSDLAGYLTKPFGPQELLTAVQDVLAKSRPPTAEEARPCWRGMHRQSVEVCLAALREPDRALRYEAASVLGWSKNKRAVEPLIRALKDEDKDMRVAAVNALALLEDQRAVEPLVGLLENEHGDVRQASVLALAKLGDSRALEPLGQTLQNTKWKKRGVAAMALARIKGDRAVELLVGALRDEDADVAWSAAHALYLLGDARALPELERVAQEDTRKTQEGKPVAEAAQKAIARLDKEQKRE